MYIKVGTSYTFPLGTADLGITREVLYNDADQPYATKTRWAFDILLVGTGATDVDSKVALLNTAFSSNGKDFILTMPNGTTNSQHVLLNSGSISGTMIRKLPSVTTFQGAGGITNIRMTAEVEAEYPVAGAGSLYRSFEESLTFEGGGVQEGYLLPLYGSPVRQTLRQRDSYRVTQQGSAVGLYSRPSAPPPLFAQFQLRAPTVMKKSPRLRGSSYEDFLTTWMYQYESPNPIQGEPNYWT